MKMRNTVKKHSLKFISALLAIFLWVYVLNSEKVKFEKTVAVEYIIPAGMMFAVKPQSEVVFLIEGPRAFVRTVAERDDKLVIDLNRANSKKQLNFTVSINPNQLSLPFGMVVDKVMPRNISISLEKKASKIVPLQLQFAGQLPDKLTLVNPVLHPSEVEVHGPRSVVSKIKYLNTRPIDLEGLPGFDQLPAEINIPDDNLTITSTAEVKFTYQLRAESSNLELKALPIEIISHSQRYKLSKKTASVKLLVPEKIIKNRSNVSSSVQVWIEIPKGAKGPTEVQLSVTLPPSIHLLEIIPKSIIVNVE
ncbi:MAG TPA: CdaR family protein [Bacteriovoracaceae bacterium]|nr:CdaR family protein [Bacteriovoracaceae bacterium]